MNLMITEEERKLLLDALERHQSSMQPKVGGSQGDDYRERMLREAWEAGQLYDRINRLL